ncbi:MAG TPA: nuclear transport factor 2 family protein [Gemmatimonadales bacterium]
MQKTLFAVAAALLLHAPAAVAQKTEVMAVVRQFIDGFNKGDVASALVTCADQTSIIDEFPPYEWHGSGSCAKWAEDFDAYAKKSGMTGPVVTLTTPKHVNVEGDRAYVVVPSSFEFTQNGKPVKQTGATLTAALQKTAAGWRITGWSWSTGS